MSVGSRVRRRSAKGGIGTVDFQVAYKDERDNTWFISWYLVRWDGKRNRTLVQIIDLEEVT